MKQFATMILLNEQEDEVLLLLREDFRIWGLPGGSLESGESPEQAAIRETREETGYESQIVRFCGTVTRPRLNDIRYIYLGRITGGEALQTGPETLALRWFAADRLPEKTTLFLKEIVHEALASREAREPYASIQNVPFRMVVTLRIMVWLRDLRNWVLGKS